MLACAGSRWGNTPPSGHLYSFEAFFALTEERLMPGTLELRNDTGSNFRSCLKATKGQVVDIKAVAKNAATTKAGHLTA